jgi:hypothetical protein
MSLIFSEYSTLWQQFLSTSLLRTNWLLTILSSIDYKDVVLIEDPGLLWFHLQESLLLLLDTSHNWEF